MSPRIAQAPVSPLVAVTQPHELHHGHVLQKSTPVLDFARTNVHEPEKEVRPSWISPQRPQTITTPAVPVIRRIVTPTHARAAEAVGSRWFAVAVALMLASAFGAIAGYGMRVLVPPPSAAIPSAVR